MKQFNNVIIIGGGPAGLAAAIYTARAGLSPLLIAGSPPGGQLALTTEVENYPGFESILGPELILKMRKHAKKFQTRFVDNNVIKVDFSKKPFEVYTYDKSFKTNTVLIATGAKALWLGLESEKRLRGKGVSACATCDGFFFRNKTVAVIGGGDTALGEALTLADITNKVYIIHRRDSFRASKIMADKVMSNPKIEVIWNSTVKEILGNNKVEGIKIKKIAPLLHGSIAKKNSGTMKQFDNETIISVDGIFVAIGYKPDTELFSNHIELDSKGYIITSARKAYDIATLLNGYIAKKQQFNNETMKQFDFRFQYMTSVSGVFAAGDCVDYLYRQGATAVGMGVAAALEIERWTQNI